MNTPHTLRVSADLYAAVARAARREFLVLAEEEVSGRALVEMLAETGHHAHLALSSEDAARTLARNPTIDTTLLDAEVPNLELWWLIDGLRQLRPEMVIIGSFEGDSIELPIELPLDFEIPKIGDVADLLRQLPPPGVLPDPLLRTLQS